GIGGHAVASRRVFRMYPRRIAVPRRARHVLEWCAIRTRHAERAEIFRRRSHLDGQEQRNRRRRDCRLQQELVGYADGRPFAAGAQAWLKQGFEIDERRLIGVGYEVVEPEIARLEQLEHPNRGSHPRVEPLDLVLVAALAKLDVLLPRVRPARQDLSSVERKLEPGLVEKSRDV